MAEYLVRLTVGFCLLVLLPIAQVQAHDLGVARLVLTPLDANNVLLEAKLPEKLQPVDPVVPEDCSLHGLGQRLNGRLSRLASWQIECPDGWQTGNDTVVLDWQREGAMVVVQRDRGTRSAQFLDAEAGVIRLRLGESIGTQAGALATAGKYLALGSEHILLGIDHLAFVLVLCLLARGMRLVKLVTAFTLGHSLTLSLAVLGWVAVPVPPVEATIALSIVFVAREAMLPESQRRHGFWLVAAFGMLHGLGFASALSELGVDRQHLLLSLLSFNIGVEVGQLLFIAVVLMLAALLNRSRRLHLAWMRTATAFGAGSLGVYWTIERLADFGL